MSLGISKGIGSTIGGALLVALTATLLGIGFHGHAFTHLENKVIALFAGGTFGLTGITLMVEGAAKTIKAWKQAHPPGNQLLVMG